MQELGRRERGYFATLDESVCTQMLVFVDIGIWQSIINFYLF